MSKNLKQQNFSEKNAKQGPNRRIVSKRTILWRTNVKSITFLQKIAFVARFRINRSHPSRRHIWKWISLLLQKRIHLIFIFIFSHVDMKIFVSTWKEIGNAFSWELGSLSSISPLCFDKGRYKVVRSGPAASLTAASWSLRQNRLRNRRDCVEIMIKPENDQILVEGPMKL